MEFQPIGTNVLVEYEENKPVNGIITASATETFDYSLFVVRGLGTGFLAVDGSFAPLPLKIGDRVAMLPSAMGNITRLPPHFCDNRHLATVDIRHIAGVWQGELPEPQPKLVTAVPVTAKRKGELVH